MAIFHNLIVVQVHTETGKAMTLWWSMQPPLNCYSDSATHRQIKSVKCTQNSQL